MAADHYASLWQQAIVLWQQAVLSLHNESVVGGFTVFTSGLGSATAVGSAMKKYGHVT